MEETSAPTELPRCEDAVTTTCLVGEIQSFLAADMDQFKRARAMLALAQAQLADGSVENALASYSELEAKTARTEFLISYAKHLIAKGDNAHALRRLREANNLLTDGQSDFDRLGMTGLSQLISKTFAQAGANEEGRTILDGIASFRSRIPMNPMLLALMLQVSKDQADIGFREEAATIVKETYEIMLDQNMEVAPEQALQIFETWASLDAAAGTKSAEELAIIVGKDGPSAFEFALWTGLSAGLASSDTDNASFLDRARSSFAAAPERSAALLLAPKLAGAMKQAGESKQARELLDRAHAEASTIASPMEKAPVLLALAEGFGTDAPEQATDILKELIAMREEPAPVGMMLRHYANAVPAQLVLLGQIDEAYDLAIKTDGGSREMALVMAADKLAGQGRYREAMRFLRKVEGEIAVMMMAGIADRLAGTSKQR
ncbi:MAG: hypothetical protein ACRECY_01115 [Phyllobacterium sp.]